jgi:hypothetical protein
MTNQGATASNDFAEPITYYLVSSEDDRASLFSSFDFAGDRRILVIVSQFEETSIFATQSELTSLGRSAEIVDLRHRQ